MAKVKVAVIGAIEANVHEIQAVVVATIGDNAAIVTATKDHYTNIIDADLYVCLINRKEEIEQVFGADKVVSLTLIPPTEYFLALSKLPAGETVYIFNNTTGGTQVLKDLVSKYQINHIRYEVIPYDEWSEQQVAEKLSQARYITGSIAYVAEGSDLYTRFGTYIPPDAAVLVSPPRLATSESVSHLARTFGSLYHRSVIEELKQLATLDYLTEIPNRRTFDEVLKHEFDRARRDSYPLLVAMIDIDFFKPYNDHYGHIAGDEILKLIANKLQQMMRRPADFCARYGGEEFALILPHTNITGAWHVLEAIKQAIMELDIKHEYSTAAPVVTISIGATSATLSTDTDAPVVRLIEAADEALYLAKRQGRNTVVIL